MLPFVDTHVHLWKLEAIRYPWLMPPFSGEGPNGNVSAIAQDYLLDDYLAEAVAWDVRGIVHVEAGADPGAAIDETRWVQALADTQNLPIAIVAHAALDHPEIEPMLAAHTAFSALRGIRHIVNWHPDPRRTYRQRDVTIDPAWQDGFGRLARHGLSFDLQCYPGQMTGLATLFARHDEVPVIVNHAGMATGTDPASLAEWSDGIAMLAALPQVAVKLSGLGFIDRHYTADFARDHVRRVIDLFGTDRVMIASDFPTDRLFGSFDTTLAALAAAVATYSDDEQRAMFAGNADRLYRLGLDL